MFIDSLKEICRFVKGAGRSLEVDLRCNSCIENCHHKDAKLTIYIQPSSWQGTADGWMWREFVLKTVTTKMPNLPYIYIHLVGRGQQMVGFGEAQAPYPCVMIVEVGHRPH